VKNETNYNESLEALNKVILNLDFLLKPEIESFPLLKRQLFLVLF